MVSLFTIPGHRFHGKPFVILPTGVQSFYLHKLSHCFFLSLLFTVVAEVHRLCNSLYVVLRIRFSLPALTCCGSFSFAQTLALLRKPVLLQFWRPWCRTRGERSRCAVSKQTQCGSHVGHCALFLHREVSSGLVKRQHPQEVHVTLDSGRRGRGSH